MKVQVSALISTITFLLLVGKTTNVVTLQLGTLQHLSVSHRTVSKLVKQLTSTS
jgi:hypothetical protein